LITSRLEVPVPPVKVRFEKVTAALPLTATRLCRPAPVLVLF